MYIQITDRCNMSCSHCGFDCGPTGDDMSIETFKAAARIAQDYGDNIFIGGGEPTLHPDFWTIMGLTLAYNESDVPGIITNGSMTETAILLANMARRGVIFAGLSQDIYHDRINPEVIQAFTPPRTRRDGSNDNRKIRDVSHSLVAAGRAAGDENADKFSCICSDIIVDPLGNIYSCGCKTKHLGTVWTPSPELYRSCKKEEEHWSGMLSSA